MRTNTAGRALRRVVYASSLSIAILMTLTSLVGVIAFRDVYAAVDPSLTPLLIAQDALNIVIGLPLLMGSMWLAHRRSLIGSLLWPGALFYVLYDYAYYVLGVPFNALFLAYLGLVTLSGYTFVAVVLSIDAERAMASTSTVPRRAIGGFLIGIAGLFTLLWTAMSVGALLSGDTLPLVPRVVTTLDLTIQLPALFVAGVLVLRRHPIGHVLAPGLLLQAGAYLAGLSAITVLDELVTGAAFDGAAVAPGLAIGAICAILVGFYVRAAERPSPQTGPAARALGYR